MVGQFPVIWIVDSVSALLHDHAGKRSKTKTVEAGLGCAAYCHSKSRNMALRTLWNSHGNNYWRNSCRFYRSHRFSGLFLVPASSGYFYQASLHELLGSEHDEP